MTTEKSNLISDEIVFSKQKIVKMNRFIDKSDLLNAMLSADLMYSIFQVESILNEFLMADNSDDDFHPAQKNIKRKGMVK